MAMLAQLHQHRTMITSNLARLTLFTEKSPSLPQPPHDEALQPKDAPLVLLVLKRHELQLRKRAGGLPFGVGTSPPCAQGEGALQLKKESS